MTIYRKTLQLQRRVKKDMKREANQYSQATYKSLYTEAVDWNDDDLV